MAFECVHCLPTYVAMAGRIGAKVGLLSWFRHGLNVSNLVGVSVRGTGLPQCKIANSQSWYLENQPFFKIYIGVLQTQHRLSPTYMIQLLCLRLAHGTR